MQRLGLSFTPFLLNKWFSLLFIALFIHLWVVFYKNRSFKESHIFLHLLTVIVGFGIFIISFALFKAASTVEFPIMDYRLEGDAILLYEQPLSKFPAYHELINPFYYEKR